MAKVNLISDANGVGLSRDIEQLSQLFAARGHQVQYHHWRAADVLKPDDPLPFVGDLAVHIELLNPRMLGMAPKNIGVFNLEWFETNWLGLLGKFDQLWAKSCGAFEWFQERHLDQARFTGFASRDLYVESFKRERRVLHVRGRSSLKGTNDLIRAYVIAPQRYPSFKMPPLTIVSRDEIVTSIDGITVKREVDDIELVALMNRHAIHACPSQAEGWGHYIAEGVGCGAYVITTDASPMNEHVIPSFGHLVVSRARGFHWQAPMHVCAPEDILDGIVRACDSFEATAESCWIMSEQARAYFKQRNESFLRKANAALLELGL